MLNRIILMGRLTRDPELRHTGSGTAVASFSLAVERDFRDKASGQRVTDFIDVVAWRQTGEFVSKYFQKGSLIAIEGSLQTRQYQDKNGQNRTATEIVAQNVNFCGSKESTSPAPQNAAQRPAAPSQRTQGEPDADYAPIDDDEGDLPF